MSFLKRDLTNDLGLEVEYWVMKPTNYKQGEKYPLLLEIHGGPCVGTRPRKHVA
jgi:dipeptidyl aminopeptidase/acylaminoacyl peptidase